MRNYCVFFVAAGNKSGSPSTYFAIDAEDLQSWLALNPDFVESIPTRAWWFGLDKRILQTWLNRLGATEVYLPAQDSEPMIFTTSPRGRGKIDWTGGEITF